MSVLTHPMKEPSGQLAQPEGSALTPMATRKSLIYVLDVVRTGEVAGSAHRPSRRELPDPDRRQRARRFPRIRMGGRSRLVIWRAA